ncbi:MAG TPA: ATP-binding cassette domain-containing protein, partial [Beijerinckiaceae bacterium]|nr:ATP-binding cassette domain-containing protein [Beijerinckiaceae bacterium]
EPADPLAAQPAPALDEEVARALDELKAEVETAKSESGRPAALEAMAQSIESLRQEQETAKVPATASDTPASAPPTAPELPRGGNLVADMRAIAAGWFHNGRASDRINRGPGDVAMPEELTAAAADRGVSISHTEKSLKALTEKDFPCIALDKAGGSHVLLGRPDKTTLLRKDGESAKPVRLSALQKIFSGVVFFVRPRPEPAGDTMAATSSRMAGPAAESSEVAAIKGIASTVAAEMFRTQKPLLLQLILATVLSNLFMFAMPLFSMAVYDRVVPHLAWETLWALSLGVMIVLIADFAIRFIRLKLMDSVGLSTATALQTRLFSRLMHGRLKDLPTAPGGVANGVREVEALCHVIPAVAISVAIDLPFFILATALIYSIAGFVAITPVLGALVMVAIHILPLIGEDAARKHSRYVGTQTNAVLEAMGAIESVKVTGAERVLLRRWERLVDASAYASHRNRLQGSLATQSSVVISQVVVVLAMIIGVYEISTGTMTIGAMTAAVLLIGRMMAPISQMMSFIHRAHQLSSAAKTMLRIFSVPQEGAGDSSEAREETPINGHIAFRNVSFTYPGEETPSLDSITLDIRPGEKVGLIGRVGSGKSTLLRLILRLHEPTSGTMMFDDRDARQISPRALRRVLGFMRQDSVLFDDTLQANICFGMETMRASDFERAVTVSGVKDFAARHPAGYGMRVGTRGERLSGGERQSVALARLLAENPKVFIMDEPTSAMDNALEARIVRDLREIIAEKTFVVATHRAPLLSLVDRIIWMENGRIVADGPKADVMQRLSQAA